MKGLLVDQEILVLQLNPLIHELPEISKQMSLNTKIHKIPVDKLLSIKCLICNHA